MYCKCLYLPSNDRLELHLQLIIFWQEHGILRRARSEEETRKSPVRLKVAKNGVVFDVGQPQQIFGFGIVLGAFLLSACFKLILMRLGSVSPKGDFIGPSLETLLSDEQLDACLPWPPR